MVLIPKLVVVVEKAIVDGPCSLVCLSVDFCCGCKLCAGC